MCGICGILDLRATDVGIDDRKRAVQGMLKSMHHRGPDGAGDFTDEPITLGAVRLAVLDLSTAANQPMISDSGRHVLVYNGEIYNYHALRAELEKDGTKFHSSGDTEVLLRLFEQRGSACLNDLQGMFAFAIWDTVTRNLFVARDRFGEKPLFYGEVAGCFVFASELKALLSIPFVPRKPDWLGIHLGLHYVHVPAPYTAFAGLKKLPPACCMTVQDKPQTPVRYWRPSFGPMLKPDQHGECVDAVAACLDQTVQQMARSDVPIGSFLSGGLDSSSVSAMLASHMPNIHTFRISYQKCPDLHEQKAAQAVSARYKTRHHEIALEPDALTQTRELVDASAEPTGTMVGIDAHMLAKHASQYITVALSGSGADEIFGGYADLMDMAQLESNLAQAELLAPFYNEGNLGGQLSEAFRDLAVLKSCYDKIDKSRIYANKYLYRGRSFTAYAYTPRMTSITEGYDVAQPLVDIFHEANTDSLYQSMVYQQLMLTCQYSLVDHADISGMAHSMEIRSPFLDSHMVDLALRIPPAMKSGTRNGRVFGKMILREAMEGRLPEESLYAPKSGFGSTVPHGEWLRMAWKHMLRREQLEDSGMFKLAELDKFVKTRLDHHPEMAHQLFNILTLGEWIDLYC